MSYSGYHPSYTNPDHPNSTQPSAPPPAYQPNKAVAYHPPQKPQHSDSDDSDDDHEHGEGELHGHCVAARAALLAYGIPSNHRAQICLALDVSGSMESSNGFYSSGKIQRLIEKMMAIAIELSAGENHTVTIFPFGKVAYEPIVLDEHDIKQAVARVYNAIGRQYAKHTNYNAVAQKIRSHYFGNCLPLNMAKISDKEPVLAFFVTDGADNLEENEARNQFRYSEYNAIFFKFIGLKGTEVNLQFPSLRTICNTTATTFLENKNLLVLNDPSDLTIPMLLNAYRPWLEEAHEHKVLLNDPGVELNPESVDDQEDIARQKRTEAEHGHEDVARRHGHIDAAPLLKQHGTFGTQRQQSQAAARRRMEYPRDDEPCCQCTMM
jgi:hypothetical protein